MPVSTAALAVDLGPPGNGRERWRAGGRVSVVMIFLLIAAVGGLAVSREAVECDAA